MRDYLHDAVWFWPVVLVNLLAFVLRVDWTDRLVLRVERQAGLWP